MNIENFDLMTFEELIELRDEIEGDRRQLRGLMSEKYDKFRNGMGLVPDSVRLSRQYRMHKAKSERLFQNLRTINTYLVMHFKEELKAHRKFK